MRTATRLSLYGQGRFGAFYGFRDLYTKYQADSSCAHNQRAHESLEGGHDAVGDQSSRAGVRFTGNVLDFQGEAGAVGFHDDAMAVPAMWKIPAVNSVGILL